jgi:hypothetical protein
MAGDRGMISPLTFADQAGADAARLADPVAPARRSQAALAKVHTRTLADGTPAMSFTRLVAHLATIVRNTLRPKSARPGEATFTLTTRPTPKQQHPRPCRRHRRVDSSASSPSVPTD